MARTPTTMELNRAHLPQCTGASVPATNPHQVLQHGFFADGLENRGEGGKWGGDMVEGP